MSANPDKATLGVCPLTMPCPCIVSGLSHPILPRRATWRTRVLINGHTVSRQHSDRTFVTVDDASFLLDRSGCRELRKNPCPRVNDGAHNTVSKCQRLQHCLSSDMPKRSQSTLLAWIDCGGVEYFFGGFSEREDSEGPGPLLLPTACPERR